ncbi:MAG: hypothetical protein Q9164_006104, partial [Protoblastenia rupestris]
RDRQAQPNRHDQRTRQDHCVGPAYIAEEAGEAVDEEDSPDASGGWELESFKLQGGEDGEEGKERGNEDAGAESHDKGVLGGGFLTLHAMVVSVDGARCVEGSRRQHVGTDADAEECGWQMARELVEKGAGEILKEIELNRGMIRGQDNA